MAETAFSNTTGHVWDENLQEFNNPLPAWWAYTFYLTVVFAVVYWLFFPSWPIGKGFLPGITFPDVTILGHNLRDMNTFTYTNAEGQQERWHWNTRSKLLKEMQDAAAAQKPYYDKLVGMSYDKISKDPELNSFVLAAGKSVFAENCAACHQSGGQGQIGLAPNLTDDDWIYGGSFDKINETITKGRHGYMPPFADALTAEQIDQLANYVLSISGNTMDAAKAAKGKDLFRSQAAACYYCHGDDAKGRKDIGSANLTDKVWLWADVPAAADQAAKTAAIKKIIMGGIDNGVMPSWDGRLSPEQIKLLTAYVHGLGGSGK